MWQISDTLEWQYYNRIWLERKLRRDWILVMLATIRSRTFCLLVCCLEKYEKIRIYRTVILPVVLYGWEFWSLSLWEEYWLRAFDNRVLERIFGPKRDEMTGGWRKLHNEELRDLYSSSIIRMMKWRKMRWEGHVARWRRGIHIEKWWESQKERNRLGDRNVGGGMILKLFLGR
jgi:hypothetical protein